MTREKHQPDYSCPNKPFISLFISNITKACITSIPFKDFWCFKCAKSEATNIEQIGVKASRETWLRDSPTAQLKILLHSISQHYNYFVTSWLSGLRVVLPIIKTNIFGKFSNEEIIYPVGNYTVTFKAIM